MNRVKNNFYCKNCGRTGHLMKKCRDPITSMGIIMIKVEDSSMTNKLIEVFKNNDIKRNIQGIKYNRPENIQSFCKYQDKIKFLMIKRKHSLGYIDFIRGKYSVDNIKLISFLFQQMIPHEIDKIKNMSFDELWMDLWNNNNVSKTNFNEEYVKSKKKFEELKTNKEYLTLDKCLKIKPEWSFSEWGFPKGRRDNLEDNVSCAIREFAEETGFDECDYELLENSHPLEETFIGTNGKNYRHIYYISFCKSKKEPKIDPNNSFQYNEIGDIGWFTYREAINVIRPHHIPRKSLLTDLYMQIINSIIDIES